MVSENMAAIPLFAVFWYDVFTNTHMETSIVISAIQIVSIYAAEFIGAIGVLIMVFGTLKGLFAYIASTKNIDHTITKIRIDVAQHLSLGLEFLVGKDIIETIIRPSMDQLIGLVVIVIIRTMIAYILSWEMREAIAQIVHEKKLQKENTKK